mgnify:FL=1
MGNNLIHINAGKYYRSNLTNLILAREEVFLNLYYEENKIEEKEKLKDNSKKNHEILKKYNKNEQMLYINSHKLNGKIKRYIKTTFFFNFNIPEIQEIVNEKIKSKDLFEESKENIESLNIFGLKVFNIVKKYINSILPEELKFISEEPLFYYYVNQLYKPLTKEYIIYTIYDFISLGDLADEEISNLFNVKSDKNFKGQIKEIKDLKKKYFNIVKKYYDLENRKSYEFLKYFLLIISVIIAFISLLIYKVI